MQACAILRATSCTPHPARHILRATSCAPRRRRRTGAPGVAPFTLPRCRAPPSYPRGVRHGAYCVHSAHPEDTEMRVDVGRGAGPTSDNEAADEVPEKAARRRQEPMGFTQDPTPRAGRMQGLFSGQPVSRQVHAGHGWLALRGKTPGQFQGGPRSTAAECPAQRRPAACRIGPACRHRKAAAICKLEGRLSVPALLRISSIWVGLTIAKMGRRGEMGTEGQGMRAHTASCSGSPAKPAAQAHSRGRVEVFARGPISVSACGASTRPAGRATLDLRGQIQAQAALRRACREAQPSYLRGWQRVRARSKA